MHRLRLIAQRLEVGRQIRCRRFDVLLIRNGAGRQERHGVAGQKFIFGIRRVAALDGDVQIALDRIFLQRVDVRRHGEIGFIVTQRAQIGKCLVHDDDDIGQLLPGFQDNGFVCRRFVGIVFCRRRKRIRVIAARLFHIQIVQRREKRHRRAIALVVDGRREQIAVSAELREHGVRL